MIKLALSMCQFNYMKNLFTQNTYLSGFYWIVLPFCYIVLPQCVPLPPLSQTNTATEILKPITQDTVLLGHIKTIQFYQASASEKATFVPPVVHISQTNPLTLEFDVLGKNDDYYKTKIAHCTLDWRISTLNEIEFINDFNEFEIRSYQTSAGTRVPYTHFSFQLPKVKIAGNYILKVFRNNDEKDLVMVRRFMVYENKVSITPKVKASTQNSEIAKNHQIEFEIDYPSLSLSNPREEIKVVIRQNYRWDNAIYDLKPLYIKDFDKKLQYTHYNLENNFKALNEFRRFDIKSTRFLGWGVDNIQLSDTLVRMEINEDKGRADKTYLKFPDYNGNYLIGHYESGRGMLESDYVLVKFKLKSREPAEGNVYVMGKFNDWMMTPENLMKYDEVKQMYQTQILLKQGEYNYVYALKKSTAAYADVSFWEGTFQETENDYDILVYYRPLGARTEQIIGYRAFNSNQVR
jgi:hypothetical protein